MKTKFYVIILLAVAAMIACTKTPNPEPEPTPEEPKEDTTLIGYEADTADVPHYILSFRDVSSLTAKLNAEKHSIWIAYNSNNCSGSFRDKYQTKYQTLCERYGDITYKDVRIFSNVYNGGYDYMTNNIVSIDVVTETNYDAEHPAGSSLNDICLLESASPYPHIQSGYTLTHDWPKNDWWQQDKGSIPFSKPLIDCKTEDMILMGNGYSELCNIVFTKLPTAGKRQLITVTLTDETGKVYTVTTEPFTW